MSIFRLRNSINDKEIGVGTQIQTFDKLGPTPYNFPVDGPIDSNREFPVFIMEKKAKRIDLLNCAPCSGKFLIMSPQAIEVFQRQDLDDFQSFPVKVAHKLEVYDYYAFYLTTGRKEYIDWKKSEFALVNKDGYRNEDGRSVWIELEVFQFDNYDSYLLKFREFRDAEKRIRPRIIKFNDSIHHDLFTIRGPITGYYCSEKFRDAIINARLTGFDFQQIPQIQFFN